jgi:hypothetical protein
MDGLTKLQQSTGWAFVRFTANHEVEPHYYYKGRHGYGE